MTTDELLQRWSDGSITADELRELTAKLAEPEHQSALLDDWLLESNLPNVLPGAAVAGLRESEMNPRITRMDSPRAKPWTNWLSWRPLTAAAAGIMFGMFCTSVVWAIASPRFAATALLYRSLVDGSFENVSGRIPSGFPGQVGEWSGDEAAVVGFERLKAKDGQRMLQFLKAEGDAAAQASTGGYCDVFQVVDLKSLRTELDKSGDNVLELSTEFFDARPSSGVAVQFFCSIYLFEGDAAAMRSQWPSALSYAIGRGTDSLITEGAAGDAHWQKATARCLWTAQADFAVIHIAAGRTPNTSGPPVQFGSLFADDVKLTVKSQPMLPIRIVQR